jgi:ABC-type nitrate/sulfonate/bicarbonate transport system ATPase subunit
MDEPLSGLDYVNKQKLCDIITKVANLNEHNTIIIISHDIESSLLVSDSAWIIGHESISSNFEVQTPEQVKIEGAIILKEYNLASMGLAWQPNLSDNPLFNNLVREIKHLFKSI